MTTNVLAITFVVMGTVHGRVEYIRDLAGVSAREFDRLSGLAEGHTRLIETGKRPRLEVDTVRGIARATGCSLDWLVNGTGDAPTAKQIRAAMLRTRSASAPESGPLPIDPDGTVEPKSA